MFSSRSQQKLYCMHIYIYWYAYIYIHIQEPRVDSPSFSIMAWVKLQKGKGANILRKPVGPSPHEHQLSCWGWYVGAPEDSFSFGGHGENSNLEQKVLLNFKAESLSATNQRKSQRSFVFYQHGNLSSVSLKWMNTAMYPLTPVPLVFCADFKGGMGNAAMEELVSSKLGNTTAADGKMHHVAVVRLILHFAFIRLPLSLNSCKVCCAETKLRNFRLWSKTVHQRQSPFLLTPSSRQAWRQEGPSLIAIPRHLRLGDLVFLNLGKLQLCLAKSPRQN